MLHITNGDCTRDLLTEVHGEKIVWCDILHAGRVPRETEESLPVRAEFHAELGFGSFDDCLAKSVAMQERLKGWPQHSEIVLWYEHDLFDQLNLIRLLDYFAQQDLGDRKLFLVNVEKYAEIPTFIGLGQLSPEELHELFLSRQSVSSEQMKLAQDAWRAFTAPNPAEIENFLRTDTSALPFLRAALLRFLQEFPSVENGLSKSENNALLAMQNGAQTPAEIFQAAQKMEDAPFCGDTTCFALLLKLAQGKNPLFAAKQGEIRAYFSDDFWNRQWMLTPQGVRVLRGESDFVRLHDINKHLGGAHLHSGATLWRWNEEAERLTTEDFAGRRPDWC